jgi:surfeit locus 1 family protein
VGPTILVVVALVLLAGLGTWQLFRMEETDELILSVARRLEAPSQPMPATIDEPLGWEYRRVRAEGRFLHDRELRLVARTNAGRPGIHILTPLERTDPEGVGTYVLVDRGWVPADRADPASRPETLPLGPVQVEGYLKAPSRRGWFQPDNRPGANEWYWTDLAAMGNAAGIVRVAPVILVAAGGSQEALPLEAPLSVDIANDHLGYAATWYTLALALVAIYLVYGLARGRGDLPP